MADGEYDIMGNPIGGTDGSGGGAGGGEASKPLFKEGDPCEVKEGGSKYRAGVVVKFDEGIGAVDVKYNDDGELECGVPVNLVRKPGEGGGNTVKRIPTRPKRSKGSKEVPLARQCYELIKTFNDKEQEAALQMLQALDAVRPAAR